MIRAPITTERRERIRVLSLRRMKAKDIAAEVGVSRSAVSKIQQVFGLNPHNTAPLSPEVKEKILRLFHEGGHGAYYISTKLSLSLTRVRCFMRTHGLRQRAGKVGCRYTVTAEQEREIRREFRALEKRIAREMNVSPMWVRKLVRKIR